MANTDNTETLRRTPLYETHKQLGAKFTSFGGWEMPVQYSGVIEEHKTTRTAVGLFDVSHMGEILVSGKDAFAFLQFVTTNDVSKLTPGRSHYSVLPNETGGAVDDIIIYLLKAGEYFICVNASNAEKDFQWFQKQATKFDVQVKNLSSQFAQLAVQGPKAVALLDKVFGTNLTAVKFFSVLTIEKNGFEIIVAKTGYTGEDGAELFLPAECAVPIWNELMSVGKEFSIQPVGLAARDTLRLEACLPLYGHELLPDMNILSSGLGWVTKFEKGDFIGRDQMLKEREQGLTYNLVGLEVCDPGVVRDGSKLFDLAGNEVGWVTSGTKTPSLEKAIAMAFVKGQDTEFLADVRGRKLKTKVIPRPFYRRKS
jgi:aminomethyltransferase